MNTEPGVAPEVVKSRRVSSVWIVPFVALIIGAWMVFYTWSNKGPVITLEFATAEGIVAEKTKIKALSVEVGQVESVVLSASRKSVIVTARLDKEAAELLREDTRFWVVRPRIGSSGVSGLGTLLSGAYIELSPGVGEEADEYSYQGLENVPPTPNGTPGLRLKLFSEDTRSLSEGDPVVYSGFTVGRVETAEFDTAQRRANYSIFIDAPYNALITENTRFWNISGINVQASADGFSVETGSLESLFGGGLTFGVPENSLMGERVTETTEFKLYANADAIYEKSYYHHVEYSLLFGDSIRGLTVGAPVEYRGISIGSVVKIDFNRSNSQSSLERRIPVLIRLDPGRVGLEDSAASALELESVMPLWIEEGLKASLKVGSLITGKLYVDLNFAEDEGAIWEPDFLGYPTIPTVPGGLAQIETQVQKLLAKLQDLPLESTVGNANDALQEAKAAMAEFTQAAEKLDNLLAQDAAQTLPEQLDQALAELQTTMKGFSEDSPVYIKLNRTLEKLTALVGDLQPLVREVKDKPNALVFGKKRSVDPEPQGR